MVDEAYILSLNSIKSCEVKVWWKFGFGQIAEDEPKDSNEITNSQNNDDKLESLEEVRYHQDQHDIVVVQITVLGELWVILNDPFKFFVQKQLDLSHERIGREQMESFLNSYNLDHEEEFHMLGWVLEE